MSRRTWACRSAQISRSSPAQLLPKTASCKNCAVISIPGSVSHVILTSSSNLLWLRTDQKLLRPVTAEGGADSELLSLLMPKTRVLKSSTINFLKHACTERGSLVPRPSSTFTFGGPGMPNQMYEWVGPRQLFCTQCHYDNFWECPQQLISGEVSYRSCCHHW